MPEQVYCFASAKGGSGKTMLSACLGTALAHLGKRVLLVDADGSTNGMTLLFLEAVVEGRGVGLFETSGCATHIELGPNLSFVPAAYTLTKTHEVPGSQTLSALQSTVSQYSDTFDYILIDAQAGIEDDALAGIEIADLIVIVSEYDPISTKGVERLKRMVPFDKTWVLYNKVLPEYASKIGDFLSVARYLPPILWSADVVRAYVKGKLLVDMDEGNLFTLGLAKTAGVLFGSEVEELMRTWREGRDKTLRQPVEDQLAEASEEVEAVRAARAKLEYEAESGGTLPFSLVAVFVAAVATFAIGFGVSQFRVASYENQGKLIELQMQVTPFEELEELEREQMDLGFSILRLEQIRNVTALGAALILPVALGIYYRLRARRKSEGLDARGRAAILDERLAVLRARRDQLMAQQQLSLDELVSTRPGDW